MTKDNFDRLDDVICWHICNSDKHPASNQELQDMATAFVFRKFARGLIQSRINAMRKAGRIKYVGNGKNNPSGKSHGWVVCIPDQSPTGEG